MTRQRSRPFLLNLFQGLGWPLLLGGLLTTGVYYTLHSGLLRNATLWRYMCGHPIEYVEVGMFFIGLAALVLRAYQLASQSEFLGRVQLPPVGEQQDDPAEASRLLETLQQMPRRFQRSWLCVRLRAALEHVGRHRSAERLEEELKYLSEDAQQQSHASYGLVRIIVWAVPMMGFLGTVMGITLALAELSPESLVNQPTQAMEGLLGGLSVAFDTTALALVLSIALMFIMFVIQQSDSRLLSDIDQQVQHQVAGRFHVQPAAMQPLAQPLRQLTQQLEKSLSQLAVQHAETWKSTIETAASQWQNSTQHAADEVARGIARSLEQGLAEHARQLTQLDENSQRQATRWWKQLQESIAQSQEVLRQQQLEFAQQGKLLLKVIEATGQVTTLQQALNENLKALAGAKNFEDTVMSLSAAIHLLNSRVGKAPPPTQRVQLDSTQGKAA